MYLNIKHHGKDSKTILEEEKKYQDKTTTHQKKLYELPYEIENI